MAVASTSGSLAVTSGIWSQIQQAQAQRNADQAEQQARALQQKAAQAQTVATRARETARSLAVESSQADDKADLAKRRLAGFESVSETQGQLSQLREQIGKALAPEASTDTASAVSAASATTSLTPVVNTSGQTTGTLVNVTA